MNPVEIEEAVSDLAREPFDRVEFPFQFLTAFDNPATTIKRLRSGSTNQSDVPGGVLQRSNIHIATCDPGAVDVTLAALRESPKTATAKAKFILATDGESFQAEDLNGGGTVACSYAEFPDHFGFFLPLAGITTVKEIRESSFDVKATGRLNRLYIQLLKENPDWATVERQHDMNHFMARLIFCFFAEDTDIFQSEGLFTREVEQLTAGDADSTHKVIGEIFRAMDTDHPKRDAANLPTYARKFPYVNGQLFSGSTDVPRFSKVARSYLMHIGSLNWQKINPDIFGSMIQAVTDADERGALGMHYTSVPNILKVLNPLFLDSLREQLEEADANGRKLLNLRNRMARIRVFDPACGSGNFLVIAYREMRAIEAEINKRRGEPDRRSDIPLTNFRGIELRDFPAEIARLALIIAEYQADVTYRGQKEAIAEFLPLGAENWITCANALRLDWLSICPPTGTGVKVTSDDLFQTPLDQAEIDFENEGGETYICGNPPYLGSTWQSSEQKADLERVLHPRVPNWRSMDYVSGWFVKAADYGCTTSCAAAFVATNSICQGQQVALLWPLIFKSGHEIAFAHTSFKWANLASNKAGVTVVIVGISRSPATPRRLFQEGDDGSTLLREVENINAYLVPGPNVVVQKVARPQTDVAPMTFGSKPVDGGNLFLTREELTAANLTDADRLRYVRRIYGSDEFIAGRGRYCLWIDDRDAAEAAANPFIAARLEGVKAMRLASPKTATQRGADWPHRFDERRQTGDERVIAVAAISSENREYLPTGILPLGDIISNKCFGIFDAPLWNLSIVASRIHWVWIGAVCVRLEMRFSYSNTLGWNTFPLPRLTAQNKADLTRTAGDILLAREASFPATIAELYDPQTMPDDLRRAHEANDEVLERIYIGRRFRNDTERLEKLFELYTRMTSKKVAA
ncbi:class I SAM-dependent DNA methyltransferase [Brevundimonas sp.]|uniref:class I SAM-dependent DNA methyltransferase n=1 Tax=Brevundimonas sp. TaxID=1871086 RepID=UPI002897FBEA|nr:DNA methyltransferase [Brevundimonas sp.]